MNQTTALIERRDFVARLLAACPDALVISGLGSPSYDLFAAGDRPENFYLWGAMGGAAAMGLGLALAHALVSALGVAGGYALAGTILLLPPLVWVIAGTLFRPRRPPPPPLCSAYRRSLANRPRGSARRIARSRRWGRQSSLHPANA